MLTSPRHWSSSDSMELLDGNIADALLDLDDGPDRQWVVETIGPTGEFITPA